MNEANHDRPTGRKGKNMNWSLIAVDKMLQKLENGVEPEDARNETAKWLWSYRNEMKCEDYINTLQTLNRIQIQLERR